MKTNNNAKTGEWSVTGLTSEQIGLLAFLVEKAKAYSGEQERQESFGEGFDYLDIADMGCIPFTESEVETLHTIDIQ